MNRPSKNKPTENKSSSEKDSFVLYNSFMNSPAGIAVFKGDTHIYEFANKEYEKLVDRKITIGKTVQELFPELEQQGLIAILNNVFLTGEPFIANEFPVKLLNKKNGKLVLGYYNVVVQPMKDEQGNTERLLSHAVEVTQQVEARKQIEISENQFRTFADSIQNLAWIANGDGWIYWYNQRWYDYTRTTLEEMEGWGWQKVHHPDHIKKITALVKKLWKKDEAFELTFPLRRHDGEYHWFLTRAYPIKDGNGNIERWIGTNTDITRQKSFTEELEIKVKERTEELRIRNQTFELAEKIAKFGSYRWNMTTGSIEYSDNLFQLLDCEPKEFEPSFEKFLSFIHPDDLQEVIENGEKTMETGILVERPYRIISKTGKIKHFRSSGSFIGDIDNRILIGTVQDVTRDIEAADELKIKNLELEHSNTELASFSYVASHDLKEPLRKIQAFSSRIIETENFTDKTQDYFNRIISAAERMQNLIDSLINYSQANTTEQLYKPCNLNTIVEEVKSDLHLNIKQHQATIEYENLPTINGMCIQLSQLFTNIIENAIKYSQPDVKPLIKITSTIIKGKKLEHLVEDSKIEYYEIKIADNGIGFEEEYANKIFEVFQRLHNKNEYSGTGIGLAIVKKIVNNHNGFIVAEGKPNMGSTFTIYLPVA